MAHFNIIWIVVSIKNATWDEQTDIDWSAQVTNRPMGPPRGQRPPTILIAISWLRRLLATGIIPILGIFGNSMTTFLLMKTKLRSHPTSIYMLALSITDSLCLIMAVIIIIPASWFSAPWNSDVMCKIPDYIMRASGETSSWVLACMSVERSMAIAMPLKSRSLLSRSKNKIVVLCCTGVVWAYFTYTLVLNSGSPRGGCTFNYNEYFTVWTRYILDYGVFILLPGVTILVANIVIVVTLVRTRDKFLIEGQNKRDSTTSSMIAMLLAASVAYLVLKTPYHLYTILVPVAGEQGRTVATSTIDWAAVGLGLVGAAQLMNHGINFYLYVITGREFRRVLKRSVCGRSKKSNLELSTMKTVSSTID
ncbi:hypothetical protein CAPTEDRAFT_186683 [Capitella teleta]|uniref:G-protein coupled receptors family 1 profile domain-containing protein n=1 Tax=Capitella teleta TaxID=283909 RepID=R7TQL3_CAPTE|nr:hypothetical protein CAPTEDRAFT_186683 [Capitella teleta]|eukprot:ELT95959.1 hypothetical protein CAPTEDRAFT_186683 [Capitella teleta]